MSQEKTIEAIVLRRSDSGESDRYLVLLSPETGKVDVVSRGARKSGSRLAGSSEPLVKARFTFAEGRHRRFVTSVQPVTSYPRLRGDYYRVVTGLAMAEITSWSSDFEFEAQEVFELLDQSLEILSSELEPANVMVWFLAKLADCEGVFPDWTACQVCGSILEESPAAVSAHSHGFLCRDHENDFNDIMWCDAKSLIALKKIVELDSPPTRFPGVSQALDVIFNFWQGLIGRQLPAGKTAVRELKELNAGSE